MVVLIQFFILLHYAWVAFDDLHAIRLKIAPTTQPAEAK